MLDALWLITLMGYILAGMSIVPFHGDESTTIWMSRDYGYTFIDHNLELVRYHDPPLIETEQQLRLATGSLTKYLMGVSWQVAGYHLNQINDQWVWGAGWDYNQQNGHAPDDDLLQIGRLPSALMLAFGAVVMFMIGRRLGGRPVAYLASLFYTIHPALLLNGRRAMFEGGHVLFSLLVILFAIWWLQKRNWRFAILLGVISGLAVSAKHPAVFTVVAAFVACVSYLFYLSGWKSALRPLKQLAVSGIFALIVFYIMNPVWWGDPIARPAQVLHERNAILDIQVAIFGGYAGLSDQLTGFARQVFIADPQYYEAPEWADYIADQIKDYEHSIWRGITLGGSTIGGLALALMTVSGVYGLWQDRQDDESSRWLIAIWSATIFLTTALLTPLEWQRNYHNTKAVGGERAATGVVWGGED
jgi:hypothetical protein